MMAWQASNANSPELFEMVQDTFSHGLVIESHTRNGQRMAVGHSNVDRTKPNRVRFIQTTTTPANDDNAVLGTESVQR